MSIDDPKPKNIILCFDGTQNQFGPLPRTNVLKLYQLFTNNSTQRCYYQPGVGVKFHSESYQILSRKSKIFNMLTKWDAAIGYSLGCHVRAAYLYLMKHFKQGDRIFLFGFRGAFTARVLAGMVESVGLLQEGLEEMVAYAYEIYCNWEYSGQPSQKDSTLTLTEEFRETFSRRIEIQLMGLWDSINSVGLGFRDQTFPYTARSRIVRHVRHAVSIDERRVKHKPVLFDECLDGNDLIFQGTSNSDSRNYLGIPSFTVPDSARNLPTISDDVIEKWFPGNHGDVGGGWPSDPSGHNLSDLSLLWMLSEVMEYKLKFNPGSLNLFHAQHSSIDCLMSYHHDILSYSKRKNPVYQQDELSETSPLLRPDDRERRCGVESYNANVRNGEITIRFDSHSSASYEQDTASDSIHYGAFTEIEPRSPVLRFDARGDESFFSTTFWYFLELLPFSNKIQDSKGLWLRSYKPNLGQRRVIPNQASFHWSVFYMMHYVEDYKPTNLPDNFNDKFIESLPYELQSLDEIQKESIWLKIPDDLGTYL